MKINKKYKKMKKKLNNYIYIFIINDFFKIYIN